MDKEEAIRVIEIWLMTEGPIEGEGFEKVKEAMRIVREDNDRVLAESVKS